METPELSLADTSFEDREFTQLWLIAAALYGVGDVVTTITLIDYVPAIAEGNLLMAAVVDGYGIVGLIALKLVVFLACIAIGLWGASDDDWVVFYGPPAILATVGAFTTVYNLWLLFGVT